MRDSTRASWTALLLVSGLSLGCSSGGDDSSSDSGADTAGDISQDTADSGPDATVSDTADDAGADSVDDSASDAIDTADAAPDAADTESDAEAPEIAPGSWKQILPPDITNEHVFKGLVLTGAATGHMVGASGVAVELVSNSFEVVSDGVFANLNGVWGASQNDAWAVGLGGLLLHWDGDAWRQPGGCGLDADCDDGDACTQAVCGDGGACIVTAVPAGEGCCGTPAFAANFDDGTLGQWAVETLYDPLPGDPEVTWSVFGYTGTNGVARYTSAPNSLYFGNPTVPCPGAPELVCPNYTGNTSPVGATATSEKFVVPVGAGVTLQFEAWIDTENFPGVDELTISAVTDEFAAQLWKADSVHANFQSYSVDLSDWMGQEIRLQIQFDSVDELGNFSEGVYLDDIRVEATCGTLDPDLVPDGPTKATLFDAWGSASNDIYAVGLGGTVIHFDGNDWSNVDLGTSLPLAINGLFGFGKNLVAVGEAGSIFEGLDGVFAAKQLPKTTALRAVWGTDATEVYAVGDGGLIGRRQDGVWSVEPVGTNADLRGVWGAGGFAVVAVGSQGTIMRRTDGAWVKEVSGTGLGLQDVWAQGTSNVFAVGEAGVVLHNDGVVWSQLTSPVATTLQAVHGLSATSVWAVGGSGACIHYNGSAWSKVETPEPTDWIDVWAASAKRVFVAGAEGQLLVGNEVDGWTEMVNPFAPEPIRAIWSESPNDVYAAGWGYVIHYDGNDQGTWEVYASSVIPVTWRGVCGTGPDNVVLVGAAGQIARYNGKTWSRLPVQPDPNSDPEGDPIPIQDQLYGCDALGQDQIWAVGENGLVLEQSNGVFVRGQNPIPISLRNVFAVSDKLVFAVGIEGFITYNRGPGQPWFPMFSGSVAGLFDIQGTTLDDITVVGDRGTILRFVPDPSGLATDP